MRRLVQFLSFAVLAAVAPGQDVQTFIDDLMRRRAEADNEPVKNLDPKRIINESNSFLKEREPEMTAEEYALHESVVTMLESNPAFALRLLEGMVQEKSSPSPAFQFILGNAYYAGGKLEQAEQSYRDAVDRYPSFLRAWNNLGVLYYTTNRYAQAKACFVKSLELGDRVPTTYGLLASCLEQEGDVIAAEQAFMQAVSSDPDNTDWKDGLLRIYLASGQYGPAESAVRSLLKLRPAETRYQLTYANILISTARKNEAMILLEIAAGTGVAGPEELALLADLYAERKLNREALAIYRQLQQRSPVTGGRKMIRFAQALAADGRTADARRILEAAGQGLAGENRADWHEARAAIHGAAGEWDLARAELESILKIDPLHGRAWLRIGRTHVAQEDWVRAQLAFEAALHAEATTYHACLELANLELRNRHYAKAVEYLEKALKLQKSDHVTEFLSQVRSRLIAEN